MNLLRAALIALVAAVTGCAAAPADDADPAVGQVTQAITNGTADDNDNAVVALLVGGEMFCSGTLISPYVVVTAGHCATPTVPTQVYFGSTPTDLTTGTVIDVAEAHAHPSYDEDSLANDIAVIELKTPASVKPKTRVAAGDLSDDDYNAPLALRIAGFGATKATDSFKARKRQGTTQINTLSNTWFKFQPGATGGTCNGDSGGPAFATVNGKEVLVGVTSAGDQNCTDYGRDMRIDAYEDFLDGKTEAYSAALETQQRIAATEAGCSFTSHGSRNGTAATLALFALVAAVRRRRR